VTIPDRVGTASRFRPLTPDSDRRTDGTVLVSYITLRRVVGFLGVGLPVIVAIVGWVVMGFWRFEPTISDYYRIESARNAFEGILFTIAWFLFTYRGFDRGDELTGEFACLFALLVAIVPCTVDSLARYHYVAAGGFFITLIVFAFRFRKSAPVGRKTPEKEKRNAVYLICAIVMILCIATIGVFGSSLHDARLIGVPAVYLLETLALWAFGVSWFIKGEIVLGDKSQAVP
jgi:hypothetical protein